MNTKDSLSMTCSYSANRLIYEKTGNYEAVASFNK